MIHPLSDVQTDKIGKGTNVWQFCVILPGAEIGENCNICSHVFIENNVKIGNNVTIKNGVFLYDGITIEDDVFIGPNATFCNDRYPKSKNKNFKLEPIVIKKGASIGANATILPGVTIGENALIGAGAVITKDVVPHTQYLTHTTSHFLSKRHTLAENRNSHKTSIDNIIFLNDYKNIRAGGPSGYLANLDHALHMYGDKKTSIAFITKECLPKQQKSSYKLYQWIAKICTLFIPTTNHRKKLRNRLLQALIARTTQSPDYLHIDAKEYAGYISILDKYEFKTVTCHATRDAVFISNYLKSRESRAKLLLMSHSPELPSQEIYHAEKLRGNPQAESIYKTWQEIEKKAFDTANILIFPTKEAMEPYLSGADYFKDLIKHKDIRFVPTGCAPIDITKSTVNIREDYHINTKYIISFIGRHTHIKGYDNLKEIAKCILSKRNDVTFVIGGTQTDEFAPLSHPRWIELGRINPADLLKISDLFILPNRQTYFDLILLEVLSAGVPVIASNTGGNKSVYNQTHAIELYDSIEECVKKINNFLDNTEDHKKEKRDLAKAAYNNNYTLKHFAQNYAKLITDVVNAGENL